MYMSFTRDMHLYEILYLKFKLSNQKTLFVPRDNIIFHCISLIPTRTVCAMEYILYFMATRVCPACCHEIQNIFHGKRGIHEL